MRMTLITIMVSISLTACSSMSGNVVPEKGPTMEQVYDSMEDNPTPPEKISEINVSNTTVNTSNDQFRKLPNPELKMYVFPHLAGNDEIPIPGYYTEFNAYTQDHYALPNEIVRG